MAIKAIISDCFGVLIMSGHNLLYQQFPQYASDIEKLQCLSDSGEISRQEFNEILSKLVKITPEQADSDYWGTNKINRPMIDLIGNLKKTGKYKTGLLSNINRDWMDESLPLFESENIFDEYLLSGDVHLMKPDPEIFVMMAKKLGVLLQECVMIDDSKINIISADQVGMKTILYVSYDQTRDELNRILEADNA